MIKRLLIVIAAIVAPYFIGMIDIIGSCPFDVSPFWATYINGVWNAVAAAVVGFLAIIAFAILGGLFLWIKNGKGWE